MSRGDCGRSSLSGEAVVKELDRLLDMDRGNEADRWLSDCLETCRGLGDWQTDVSTHYKKIYDETEELSKKPFLERLKSSIDSTMVNSLVTGLSTDYFAESEKIQRG